MDYTFADELDNAIYLYSFNEKYENMSLTGKYKPNETEEMTYVSKDISKDYYLKNKAKGSFIAMCLTSLMKDDETILFSVSLPKIFYLDEEKNNLLIITSLPSFLKI